MGLLMTPEERKVVVQNTYGTMEDVYEILAKAAVTHAIEWLSEPCPHGNKAADTSWASRYQCEDCMDGVREELKK